MMKLIVVAVIFLAYQTEAVPSGHCLDCIWQVESQKAAHLGCRFDVTGTACGPYQIHYDYYKDCTHNNHATESQWKHCAQDAACARTCVINYLKRYGGIHCPTNCEGYAKIHNGGPDGCHRDTADYWRKIVQAGCSAHS